MNAEFVARFFEGLCPSLGIGSVAVELVDGVTGQKTLLASVGWLAESWRILVTDKLEPRETLHTLFHEAAHVKHGDVSKVAWYTIQHTRDYMTGRAPLTEQTSKQSAPAEHQVKETRADQWADEQTELWWPVLVATDRAIIEATGGRA